MTSPQVLTGTERAGVEREDGSVSKGEKQTAQWEERGTRGREGGRERERERETHPHGPAATGPPDTSQANTVG